ncbi:hypothetical protein BGW36DRAFT_440126 [Talaromyces proteolyticus]|uniref:Zn(2)-C6 fungal-type domain-containing protein n=1 Tax=Talaromyces proteolyticus TaxID=1131652 RepID=A0AAD4KI19_9EURO|nr:uncharacterized protein BGW36DRAFT_440126 [Talaromyces proteolyticus]KAH8690799.1 hypothetical protein BGW36DRAFT_440126 [Talaromyces proteolyticus]
MSAMQCAEEKVRCSGDRPNCQRCVRTARTCVYEQKEGYESRRNLFLTQSTTTVPLQDGGVGQDLTPSMHVPGDLLVTLIPIYFSHIYNASLLLHRPSFEPSAIAGREKPQVVLSVCAFASRFLRSVNCEQILDEQRYSRSWANQAARLAMSEIEDPQEANLVTCMNLALFWYSLGEWRKSFMFKAHVLGLSFERPDQRDNLKSEIRRRKYWACHAINAFSSDILFFDQRRLHQINLKLPCADADYEAGIIPDNTTNSIYGEMIKALDLWAATAELVRTSEVGGDLRISAMHTLDKKIEAWWNEIPQYMRLEPKRLALSRQDSLPRLLLIHIIYHQCLCSLHSSIVPIFSLSVNDPQSSQACQLSAQIAYENANIASEYFSAALDDTWDPSRIPSFVAYAAYGACSIQIPFIWCTEKRVREVAHRNVAANIRMIHHLKKYWKFAALLVSNLIIVLHMTKTVEIDISFKETNSRMLYQVHSKIPHILENEPKFMTPERFNIFTGNSGRARLSVLTHNAILLGNDGVVAENAEQVDCGTNDISLECVALPTPNTAAELETESFDIASTSATFSDIPYLDPALFTSDFPSITFDMESFNEGFPGVMDNWE